MTHTNHALHLNAFAGLEALQTLRLSGVDWQRLAAEE